jgi:hypothetical protein
MASLRAWCCYIILHEKRCLWITRARSRWCRRNSAQPARRPGISSPGAAIGGVISAVILAVARLAGSTATIIMLVPHTGSAGWMMVSRVAEVGWGVAVAITIVWVVNRAETKIRDRRPRVPPA